LSARDLLKARDQLRLRNLHALRTLLLAGCVIVLAGTVYRGFIPRSASAADVSADPVIAILPFDALSVPALGSYSGFALSEEEVMVVLPEKAVLPESRVTALIGEPRQVVERHPEVPLWISASRIGDYALEGTGARFVYRGDHSTVVEADLATVRDLMSRGLVLTELVPRPLAELTVPCLAEMMLDDILSDRPLTGARRRFMSSLADSVDTLRMWSTLEDITWDQDAQEYRSRYSCREELRDYTAPLLVDRLAGYLGPYGGELTIAPCLPNVWGCPELPPSNIVAYLPGRKTGAHYIVCAHYDATASREPLWDWTTDPAPGADDNGTGVAVLLECARLLAPLQLDVGLKFIGFSGEEQGLRGSKCYTDSIWHLTDKDSVLGVINVDMVGYARNKHPVLTLAYDWKSGWLSDQLSQASIAAGLETDIEQVNLTGIPMSDHFPFWQIGIPGVLFIEELEGTTPVNPDYHSLGDTQDDLTMSMLGDNAGMVVGFLSRFAPLPEDTLADLELTEGSVEWDWEGRTSANPPVAGDSIQATLRAVNLGSSMDAPEPYVYEVWKGSRDTGSLVHRSNQTLELLSGEYTEIDAFWQTDKGAYGDVRYVFVLEPVSPDAESDVSNNEAEVSIETMAPSATFENLHVFPNPVVSVDDASIAFNIYHPDGDFDGAVDIYLYEMLGRKIGYGRLERSPAKQEIDVGRNAVNLADFLESGEVMPPGLYLVVAELRLIGSSGAVTDKFKFAVDR
jgi:hypothetical protein